MTKLALRLTASLLAAFRSRRCSAVARAAGHPDDARRRRQIRPGHALGRLRRRDVMIPMRDGTKLYTVIVMKKGTTNGPILLSRTPYDAHGDTHRNASQRIVDILPAMDAEFVDDGYIRVYQDIRGMHRSEGTLGADPADRRAAQQYRNRREHRCLRHDRLAGEARAGIERQGRRRSAPPTSASRR